MLFASWKVRVVKNCDLGLENAALGLPPSGRSILLYGPPSRQITNVCLTLMKSYFAHSALC